MKAKALLIIGGSELQIPSLLQAKKLGLKILLSDVNENAPGRRVSDEYLQVDGTDSANLMKKVKILQEQYEVLGAYCANDFGLISVAKINQKLQLNTAKPKQVAICQNKIQAKKILSKAGIATPNGRAYRKYDEVNTSDLEFPIIVKPSQGSGSRGVSYVEDTRCLKLAMNKAFEVSQELLIEQAIEGRQFDINGFFADGSFFEAGQLERYFSPLPNRVPIWGEQPARISQKNSQKMYDLLRKSAEVLKINDGPVKADIILADSGPQLIEISPRFHGDISTFFVSELAYGFSPTKFWFQWLTTKTLPNPTLREQGKIVAGWKGIFPTSTGRIRKIKLPETCKNSQIVLCKKENDYINTLTDNTSVIGFIVAQAENRKELRARLIGVRKKIKITIEDI